MTGDQAGTRLGYIPAIDGLRAVAVTAVILYHLWPAALPGGFTGVDIFFVISGFVVTGSLLGKRFDSLGSLAAYFYARRLVRIMPALVTMLLAAILATQLFVPNGWLSNSVPRVAEFAFVGLSNVVLATDTDTYFGPQAAFNPFTHTWSLGVEEQFYLAFPFILYWHQRLHGRQMPARRVVMLVAGLTLGSFVIGALLTGFAHKFAFYLIFARFWELGVGMLLCLTRDWWAPRLAAMRIRLVLAAAGTVLVASGLATPETLAFPVPLALLPVLGAAALIAAICAVPESLIVGLLGTRPFVVVGLLSYSLYLWHWPVFVLFRWTLGLDAIAYQLIALAAATVLAALSYLLVERPLRASPRIAAMPRARVAWASCAGVIAAAAIGVLMLAEHDRISLSVTRDHALWYADDHPIDPARTHCPVEVSKSAIGGGTATSWQPSGCAVGFAVYVPSDSHGEAYAPAFRQLAGALGVPIRAYFKAGCPILKLNEPDDPRGRCGAYFKAVYDDLRARARAGDVIFLPGLRLTRFTNQFGPDAWPNGRPDDTVSPKVYADARATLAALEPTGATFVFEAPKPLYRVPAFRCADWFNRANPICAPGFAISRAELEKLRLPVLTAMNRLAAELPRVRVWDPFPILCPADPCRAIDAEGRPLVFDTDHLSGWGNALVYPSLRDAIFSATTIPEPSSSTDRAEPPAATPR